MKIIHALLGKANPDRMNGVNKVVHALASHQHALGYEVSIWGITSDPEGGTFPRDFETRLFQDHGAYKALDPVLKTSLSAIGSDVVFHLHGGFNLQLYKLSKLLVHNGIPYLFTPHGAYNKVAMQRNKWRKNVYVQFFERYLVHHAAAVQLIGASEVAATLSLFKGARTILIPNGQEPAPHTAALSPKSKQVPVFGCLGRLDMHTKGLDLLLEGLAHFIHSTGQEAQLHLIGDGPDKQELAARARVLRIEPYLRFCGPRFGHDKWAALQDLDILVQASRNEGLPGAVLEAAASKVPVLVSTASNMGEYVTRYEAGLCLPQNDALHISKALSELCQAWQRGTLARMQANAYTMVQQEFAWPHIARQLSHHYQQILGAC